MGFAKGNDGKARSIKNPLEGSIGNADLGNNSCGNLPRRQMGNIVK